MKDLDNHLLSLISETGFIEGRPAPKFTMMTKKIVLHTLDFFEEEYFKEQIDVLPITDHIQLLESETVVNMDIFGEDTQREIERQVQRAIQDNDF